jgi:predicted dehydrogenase
MKEPQSLSNKNLKTRRGFMGGVIAASVAPRFISSRVLGGETAPSRTIRLGHIGTGGQGTGVLQNFLGVKGAMSVALADPFRERLEAAGRRVLESQKHEPKLYNDFRELLADKSIDAVVIATPDHWHVPIGLAAVRAGKDVYIEKPLGYTLNQNRAMMAACRKHERVFQYGTQQRSQEILKRGIELVLNGYIGELQRIEAWAPGGSGGGSLEEIPVPAGLDYEMYIGPAPMKPCTKDRITTAASWHCSDYALGFIAGWGAHPLDIAVWGMEDDKKGPTRFRGTGVFPTPDGLFDTCGTWDVEIKFGSGLPMRFMSHNHAESVIAKYRSKPAGDGTTFYGSKGWVSLSRGIAEASNPDWLKLKSCEGNRRVLYRNNYYAAFVESVRERTPSVAPIEDAVRSDALSHLSLMAIKSGEEVVWDPEAYRILSPDSLKSKMDHKIRGEWAQS